jgi:hypothetical protein
MNVVVKTYNMLPNESRLELADDETIIGAWPKFSDQKNWVVVAVAKQVK